jgi:hypothetical protein
MTNIITPTDVERPCYEGELEVTPESLNFPLKSEIQSVADAQNYSPVVTLGQPQEWNLRELARTRGETSPTELSLLLQNADFYLLLLACSFRPKTGSEITFARLTVSLAPKLGAEMPIAFDLYPRLVENETKQDVQVKIAPSLKFEDVEVSLGEVLGTIEFRRLEPSVVAAGFLESAPNWDYHRSRKHPLQGGQFSYLIVKKPHRARSVIMTLSLSADVEVGQGFFRSKLRETARAQTTLEVCAD